MIHIGQKAPNFNCDAVVNNKIKKISLDDCKGSYTAIFFYPLDFTFVCPTELHAFQEKLELFKAKKCTLIGISIDSVYSHTAWLATPKNKGGIEGITYPLISDINKTMSRDYGVLDEENGVALRGLFILDNDNIVQHATINNLGVGRNVDEVLRLIEAFQYHQQHGDVCPANWSTGAKTLKPTQEGVVDYFG